MANIDLKKIDTTDYVAGDLHLTKSSSGELNWTPAHQAPYELLADDISSKTNTKGLVSGDQLSKLIPDIPELTQANIDNKDDVSGTVNPSKVSFGGGGGGDEVLKDWTYAVSGSDLLAGLGLHTQAGFIIEMKELRGSGALGLDVLINGAQATDGYNRVGYQTQSYTNGSTIAGTNQRKILEDTDYYEGKAEISFFGMTGTWPHGNTISYLADSTHVNKTPAVRSTRNLVTVYTTPASSLNSIGAVVTGSPDGDDPFVCRYRIIRK
jgi:hypothetical protein